MSRYPSLFLRHRFLSEGETLHLVKNFPATPFVQSVGYEYTEILNLKESKFVLCAKQVLWFDIVLGLLISVFLSSWMLQKKKYLIMHELLHNSVLLQCFLHLHFKFILLEDCFVLHQKKKKNLFL